jgi:hypothetical protein
MHDLPLLAVALIVFAGLFITILALDNRTRALEAELKAELAFGVEQAARLEKAAEAVERL